MFAGVAEQGNSMYLRQLLFIRTKKAAQWPPFLFELVRQFSYLKRFLVYPAHRWRVRAFALELAVAVEAAWP